MARAASPIFVPPGSMVLTTSWPASTSRRISRRSWVDFPQASRPSNAISFPRRSIALTSKQNGQDDEDGADGDAGVGDIEDGKSSEFEKIQDVPPLNPIDEVANSASQDEGHACSNQTAIDMHREQNEKQNDGYDAGDDQEDYATSGEDSECTPFIVNTG